MHTGAWDSGRAAGAHFIAEAGERGEGAAQMLDLQNLELAKAWLFISANASAAIYFNEDDELTVLTRDGSTQLLISSPFAQQLDQCVVYLDDAHTRGTDIKFPSGFRAAVTLGPKVTKDRLTQGTYRLHYPDTRI